MINEKIVEGVINNYRINISITLSSGTRSDHYFDIKFNIGDK